MAISRMNMERQLRNMGGLMTLEEPRKMVVQIFVVA